MESLVKIVGAGVDTLVMNIYPTDSASVIVKRRIASDLKLVYLICIFMICGIVRQRYFWVWG